VEIVESIVEIEVAREDNIEERTKRGITMPHMYSSIRRQNTKMQTLELITSSQATIVEHVCNS
jgi:hypothetical protein